MDRAVIDKIARTGEDRLLLAKLWDKIQTGIRRGIPASTCFLTLRELDLTRYLFGSTPGLYSFGGYPNAERKMLVYLPEYLEEAYLTGPDSPVICLHGDFYPGEHPTHRDFLGALLGSGIAREVIGDICVGENYCEFFVTDEIAPYLLQNFTAAGATHIQLKTVPLSAIQLPQAQTKQIRDTLASLRLDSVVSAGFRISRGTASDCIAAGKVAVDGLPCEKADKSVGEGAKISLRGQGKIRLAQIGGQTKKGRICVTIERYL